MSVINQQAREGYKFEKDIFNISLNSVSVSKYVKNNKNIRLIVECDDNMVSIIQFDSAEECFDFIDKKCDEDDQIYNTARALQSLIDAIK